MCNKIDEYTKAIAEIRNGKSEGYVKKARADVIERYDTRVQARQYSDIYMAGLRKNG